MDWIWNKVKGVFQDIYDFLDWINPFSDSAEERAEKEAAERAKLNARAVVESGAAEEVANQANAILDKMGFGANPLKLDKTEKHEVGGTIRVEGVNDQGQFIGAADYTMNQLSKQLERDARLYSYGG